MEYRHEAPAYLKHDNPRPIFLPSINAMLWDQFYSYMQSRELSPKLARDNAWFPSDHAGDRLPRIVIPCSTASGKAYWQARYMGLDKRANIVRYQSPSAPRGDALVIVLPNRGTYGALQGYTKQVVIVEGPLDALAAAGAGYTGIGLMGNRPSSIVLTRLAGMFRDTGQEILLYADSDAVGAMTSLAATLAGSGLKTRVAYDIGYKDVASMPGNEREAILQRLFTLREAK